MSFVSETGSRINLFSVGSSKRGGGSERLFSKTLPINVELLPRTFYFLTSITKYASKFTYQLHFTASVEVKNDNSEDFINLGEHDVSE